MQWFVLVFFFFILYTYRPLHAFTHLYFRALYHFSHNSEFLKGMQCKELQLIAVFSITQRLWKHNQCCIPYLLYFLVSFCTLTED